MHRLVTDLLQGLGPSLSASPRLGSGSRAGVPLPPVGGSCRAPRSCARPPAGSARLKIARLLGAQGGALPLPPRTPPGSGCLRVGASPRQGSGAHPDSWGAAGLLPACRPLPT